MYYADTSALIKLCRPETESDVLRSWISAHPGQLITNIVGHVELQRVAARCGESVLRSARQLLGTIDRIAITDHAAIIAANIAPATVRSLDALHIGSAASLHDAGGVLSYDKRFIEAARAYGLAVFHPC